MITPAGVEQVWQVLGAGRCALPSLLLLRQPRARDLPAYFQGPCPRQRLVPRGVSFALFVQIPVALAMWNQVAAECILLIRTYAFFNRNIYVLVMLVSALAGVVAYQLYVATSQMLRECMALAIKSGSRTNPLVTTSSSVYPRTLALMPRTPEARLTTSQEMGPCLPMSKPHSAHLLGRLPSFILD